MITISTHSCPACSWLLSAWEQGYTVIIISTHSCPTCSWLLSAWERGYTVITISTHSCPTCSWLLSAWERSYTVITISTHYLQLAVVGLGTLHSDHSCPTCSWLLSASSEVMIMGRMYLLTSSGVVFFRSRSIFWRKIIGTWREVRYK